jgi:hypothetical protein
MRRRALILGVLVLCQLIVLLVPLRAAWALLVNPDRAWSIAKAYDRLGNVVANGDGKETISSRANRARQERRRWGCILCRWLDAIDKDHCRQSAGE